MKKKKTYTWRIYSDYGYVEAPDMVRAIHKVVDCYWKDKNATIAWGDIYVKEGKHEVY